MDSSLAIVILGAATAGFVQGLSGFAFALVAMSIWAWAVEPQLAAALSVCGGLTGQLIAALTIRRRFEVKLLLPFLAGGLVGIPIGILILPNVNAHWFQFVLGGFLVLYCPAMLMMNRLPAITHGGRVADSLIGTIGGIMGGLGGFAGTIPTLWCTLRGLDKDTQRALIQNFNLTMQATTMLTYVSTGVVRAEMTPMLAVVAVAVLIPCLIGTRLYHGISEAAFKRLVLGLLTASGIALLVFAVPKVLA